MKIIPKRLGYISTIVIVTIFSCSPAEHRQTLSFFFDGIAENGAPQKIKQDSIYNIQTIDKHDSNSTEKINPDQIKSGHPDYRNRMCDKCHDINRGHRLIQRQPAVCYGCHTRFEVKHEKIHGPVAAGFCNACHLPHQSQYPALLKMSLRNICQHCHEAGDVNKNMAHRRTSEVSCHACHDPHGGKDLHMLKEK